VVILLEGLERFALSALTCSPLGRLREPARTLSRQNSPLGCFDAPETSA